MIEGAVLIEDFDRCYRSMCSRDARFDGQIIVSVHAGPGSPEWNSRADIVGRAAFAWLGGINVALAVFNVIPAAPLDGGRLLRSRSGGAPGTGARRRCGPAGPVRSSAGS